VQSVIRCFLPAAIFYYFRVTFHVLVLDSSLVFGGDFLSSFLVIALEQQFRSELVDG